METSTANRDPESGGSSLQRYWVMMKPSHNWRTQPLQVAAEGNPSMLNAVHNNNVQRAGVGAKVIEGLANLYRKQGRKVLLFESSQAMERVTTDLIGHPDPDYVFTVDYISGYKLARDGVTARTHVNILNTLTATPRTLEHFVSTAVMERLGVNNCLTQPEGCSLEGGDFDFIPHAIAKPNGASESILVMGKGQESRSNDQGREWLQRLFSPDQLIVIENDQFHRDLVSAFMEDVNGRVVQVLLALEKIDNRDAVVEKLRGLGIKILEVPGRYVASCAPNVSIDPGRVIGMQSFGEFDETFKRELSPSLNYSVLPDELQEDAKGFSELSGGANCVTGSVLANPNAIDDSPANIRRINAFLHGKEFEDELRAHAKRLDLKERIESLKADQRRAHQ